MAHLVKCSICGVQFDRDKIQAVRTGARRYAHQTCDPTNTDLVPLEIKEENKELTALKDYINKLYGNTANWVLINKQIKDYQKEYNYTLSGILKSLVWFYEVKANSPEKSNGGIGIVPFCYQDAYNYYYNLFVMQSQNEKNIVELTNKVKEVTIPPPEIRLPKRLFNLDDEVDNDNEVH